MRLWSISPEYLDCKGLVAAWREALGAQAILAGKTKGYANHPQMIRFIETNDGLHYIGEYLLGIYEEATKRGYNFNYSKIIQPATMNNKIPVTYGQVQYEVKWLLSKLSQRDQSKFTKLKLSNNINLSSIFKIINNNDIEPWEIPKL